MNGALPDLRVCAGTHTRDAPPALTMAVGLILLAACARPGQPPGGPADLLPPQVVATVPDTFGALEDMNAAIEIRFNERISERTRGGPLEAAVLISPQPPGDVEVKHLRRGLSIRPKAGFRPGLLYRITILPIVQDMFSNSMADAFEFVFSTGGDLVEGVVAGRVTDRITGTPSEGVTVAAGLGPFDDSTSIRYVSSTDSAGIYALRYVPDGDFEVRAFNDQNRNRAADGLEPLDTARVSLAASDTVFLDLRILAPDTTPARVTGVEIADSVTLKVQLDDYLDQERRFDNPVVVVTKDGEEYTRGFQFLHAHRFEQLRRQEEAASRAAADTTGAAPPALPAAAEPDTTTPLPIREFYVRLVDTLEIDVRYGVDVSGIVNINLVDGGFGTDTIVRVLPADTVPPDSIANDTTVVDTMSVDASIASRRPKRRPFPLQDPARRRLR